MEFKTPKKIDQYKKIRKMALAGKLGAFDAPEFDRDSGSCMYRTGDRRCGVGALFNEAQLDSIEEFGLNASGIVDVAEAIGVDKIELVTGFRIEELIEIQGVHDSIILNSYLEPDFGPLIEFLDEKIKELKLTT